jgi:hypothetical protein
MNSRSKKISRKDDKKYLKHKTNVMKKSNKHKKRTLNNKNSVKKHKSKKSKKQYGGAKKGSFTDTEQNNATMNITTKKRPKIHVLRTNDLENIKNELISLEEQQKQLKKRKQKLEKRKKELEHQDVKSSEDNENTNANTGLDIATENIEEINKIIDETKRNYNQVIPSDKASLEDSDTESEVVVKNPTSKKQPKTSMMISKKVKAKNDSKRKGHKGHKGQSGGYNNVKEQILDFFNKQIEEKKRQIEELGGTTFNEPQQSPLNENGNSFLCRTLRIGCPEEDIGSEDEEKLKRLQGELSYLISKRDDVAGKG